jgi:hypothetical protein
MRRASRNCLIFRAGALPSGQLSEMGYAAGRDFEFAWRDGRGFNRSITLSVIDVISCTKAELRALIVQLQRSETIWPSHSRAAPIAGGNRILLTLMAASSPLKQANGTQIQSVRLAVELFSPAN